MRVLVVLALAWCCSGQFTLPYNAVPYPLAVRYQSSDVLGQTTFGHQSPDQARHEVRFADGRVLGQFSYIDANGEPAVTFFEAGPQGYRVLGSNNLPEAPTAKLAVPVDDLVAPEPVKDTPEVSKAKSDFLKIHEDATAGKLAVPVDDLVAPEPVKDTPEVSKAKAEFLKIHEDATAAALATAGGNSRQKRQVFYSFNQPTLLSQPIFSVKTETEGEDSDQGKLALPNQQYFYTFPATSHDSKSFLTHPNFYTAYSGFPFVLNHQVVGTPVVTTNTPTKDPENSHRAKRDVSTVPFPYVYTVPAETKTTFETKQYETVDAATPADTTKVELTTKEHVFATPTFKYYVQPTFQNFQVKPTEYSADKQQVFTYPGALPFYPFAFPGYTHPALFKPVAKTE